MVALVLGLVIFMIAAALKGSAVGRHAEDWLPAFWLRSDALADQALRLRVLIILFAGIAGIRLFIVGFVSPARRWSLIIGAAVIALCLARELPWVF